MPRVSIYRGGKPYRRKKFKRGASLHDMVMAFNPQTKEWEHPTICLLNDAPVLRRDWGKIRPAENDRISFVALPLGGGGGGSNPLQVILTIVATVVSIYVGGVAGAWVGAMWGSAAGSLAQGLVTGALMMLGGSLIGSIFGTGALPSSHQGKVEDASPTYSLGGANNMARLGQAVPEGFGRIKIIPDRVTYAWPIYVGNELYLHQVFALGRGLYDVEALMFGDTVFWTKYGGIDSAYEVEVEICEPGQKVTLFPDNVEMSVEVSGQRIYAPNEEEYAGWVGPFSANPPGTSTNRIVNNITFPQGIGKYDNSGNLKGLRVSVVFQGQRIDDYGNALSGWFDLAARDVTMATLTPQRISIDASIAEGRYQVRARRTNSVDLDGRSLHMVQWETLQSFLPGSLSYDQSVVAVKAKATNTLSQQATSRFGVIYTRRLPLWNRAAQSWTGPTPTRSFAAAVAQIVRADYGGGLPDKLIDLDSLWAIDAKLAAKGWTFDGYFDGFNTIWQLIMEMCQPFGVVPRISGGVLTFIYDQPGRPVRHIFTPENIVRGSLSITYNTFTDNTPDDVSIEYLDEEAGFQRRDVQAVLPDSEGRSTATRNFIGVVKRRQAFYMGVRLAAANRHRRLEFKWQTEGVGRLISIGDVAAINHPFFASVQSGVISDWNEQSLMFDLGKSVVDLFPGDVYLALNGASGQAWGPCRIGSFDGAKVKLDSADYALILAQYEAAGRGDGNPFKWVSSGQNSYPTIWKIESGPTHENRVIISSVQVIDRFHYEITAINDAPDAYKYQDLPVPTWQYRTHVIPEAELTAPAQLSAVVSGKPFAPVLVLTWLPVPGAYSYLVEYSSDSLTWQTQPEAFIDGTSIVVELGYAYVRVAAKNSVKTSAWAYWSGNIINMFYPAASLSLSAPYRSGHFNIEWTLPDDVKENSIVSYVVEIVPYGSNIAARTQTLVSNVKNYNYTLSMGLADGGPWRRLTVRLEMKLVFGSSRHSELELYDPNPAQPESAEYSVAANSITLNSVTMNDDDYAGFVIVRGGSADFGLTEIIELRTTRLLPFTWSGLQPSTTYYFRIAAYDDLYNVLPDHFSLNYSAVMAISTLAGV